MRSFARKTILDFSEEEGLMHLRHLQLEAYGSVVSALRADGNFGEEKKSVLKQLQILMNISTERHRAEVRRAVNSEKLSTIAYIRTGEVCDVSWQKEGRRLFGVLRRATPITAYTEIANQVALIAAQENELIAEFNKKGKKRPRKELGPITLPVNPRSLEKKAIVSENIKDTKTKSVDASTSTSDLFGTNLDNPPNTKAHYVYLPGGTVVHLEKGNHSNEGDKTSRLRSSSPTPKRRRSMEQEEPPLVVKDVYHPDEMKEYRKLVKSPVRKRPQQTVFIAASNASDNATKKSSHLFDIYNSEAIASKNIAQPYASPAVGGIPFNADASKPKPVSLKRDKKDLKEIPTAGKLEKPGGSIIPQAPVPPEHLYAVGASTRPKSSSRVHSTTWATKNNSTTNTSKIKKRINKSPMQNLRKFGTPSTSYTRLGWDPLSEPRGQEVFNYDNDRSVIDLTHGNNTTATRGQPGSKVMHVKYSPLEHRHLPINDSLFASEQDTTPQKVFRPSLRMTGTKQPNKDRDFMSASTTVETGLASVSSIVSRVSSPAEGLTDRSHDYDVTESAIFPSSGKVKMIRPTSQKGMLLKSRPSAASSGQFSTMHFSKPTGSSSLSKSHPESFLRMNRDKDSSIPQTSSDTVTFEIKSLGNPPPSPMFGGNVVKLKPGVGNYKIDGDRDKTVVRDPPSGAPPGVSKSSTSVSLAASGLCALASAPIIGGDPKSNPQTSASKDKQDSGKLGLTNNIIKVTPRPMTSPKVVTQIPGQRSKPSIIVVHRPPGGKTVTAAPAKFLEIGNKPLTSPQLKQVGSSKTLTVPVCSTSSVVKPTKLVSVAGNVRTVTGKPVSATRVITKGKMQQLVLKPSSSLITTSQRPGATPISRVFSASSERQQPPQVVGSGEGTGYPPNQQPSDEPSSGSMSMPASSTIKALMAIQMSSGQNVLKEVRTKTVVTSLQPSYVAPPAVKATFKPYQLGGASRVVPSYVYTASDDDMDDDDDDIMGIDDE